MATFTFLSSEVQQLPRPGRYDGSASRGQLVANWRTGSLSDSYPQVTVSVSLLNKARG